MGRGQQKIPFRRSVKAECQGEAPESATQRAELSKKRYDTESSSVKVTIEAVVSRENLKLALARVVKNAGAAGIDEMTVKELPEFLKTEWSRIKEELLTGSYQPNPVKRVEIPKPDGGIRKLGIPTVLDRFIQQAVLQVLQSEWDKTFSEASYGFRPGRNAHQAVAKAEEHLQASYAWVVDIDLEKFFDRVNHNRLLAALRNRVSDERVVKLIHSFLKAGVMESGVVSASDEGTPQGGPLSPILSNFVLDELDKELERRNHRFVRYADDCNIYVKSQRAGERVMESIGKFITGKLKLKINQEKSAVAHPWKRKILGFSFNARSKKRIVAPKSIERLKARIRKITSRTGGKSLEQVVSILFRYLTGWREYFSFAHHRTVLREIDSWIKRKLRCMLYKQWGSRRYRELRARGVSQRVAWVTYKAPHGPWRLSHCPGLQTALPTSFFQRIGLPSLARSY